MYYSCLFYWTRVKGDFGLGQADRNKPEKLLASGMAILEHKMIFFSILYNNDTNLIILYTLVSQSKTFIRNKTNADTILNEFYSVFFYLTSFEKAYFHNVEWRYKDA